MLISQKNIPGIDEQAVFHLVIKNPVEETVLEEKILCKLFQEKVLIIIAENNAYVSRIKPMFYPAVMRKGNMYDRAKEHSENHERLMFYDRKQRKKSIVFDRPRPKVSRTTRYIYCISTKRIFTKIPADFFKKISTVR